ncbi:MAG: gamma carbonic anhydrase family protein, partial [Clostridia bacterium]|nr:gamma carbonic anhydrase family protein [Clostridia bacterium]
MKIPQIHPSATVFPHAVVLGDVTLMEDSSLWFGAVVRAELDSLTVGRRSNIQDNCVVHVDSAHPCRIGDGVTVGHGAILHGCTIGSNSLIGMGAVVLNDAVIGDNCIVGARALVTGGKVFPDGWLIMGVPA